MKDNRRDFIKNAGKALVAGSVGSAFSPRPDPPPKKYLSGDALQELVNKSKIRISVAAPVEASATQLSFYKQAGISQVLVWSASSPNPVSVDYDERKKYFADAGLTVFGINNHSLINDEKLVLNLAGRDESIERYKQHLRALGKAGIGYTTYSHLANGIWSSATGTARAGAVAKSYNAKQAGSGQWGDKIFTGPLSHGKEYTQQELWANFEYFIKAILPVAKEANVKIGIASDDPPASKIAGVPRLFSSFASYKRAMDLTRHPNIGICLSVGTWAQAGTATGKDVTGMLGYFGKEKKLFEVRLNNYNKEGTETFVDGGSLDIYRVMKTLKKIDFDGLVIADHMPQMTSATPRSNAAYDPSLAWTIGYVKCLRDRVEEESVI